MTDADRPLAGKVALITGAARGQGAAEAELFARRGAIVIVTDVLDSVRDVAASIASRGGQALSFAHDVTDRDAWERIVADSSERFGGIDVLVNNAGVCRLTPVLETAEDAFREVLEINLLGAWHGIQTVVPSMLTRGGGSVVNVASIAGIKAVPGGSAYMCSKFALRGLTKAAAVELGPKGVRVNAILPGIIDTEMTTAALAGRGTGIVGTIPVRRIGEAGDVAELAAFLASDAAGFITGADFVVDGGSTA